MIDIIKAKIKWKKPLIKIENVNYIVIHHIEKETATVGDIHTWHLNNGWYGIGYNFYIRSDGNIYECRGFNEGAHCKGYNEISLGVALEGNFMKGKPSKKQIDSLVKLCEWLLVKYPNAKIKEHKELANTDCCGVNFNIDEIRNKINTKNYYKDKLIKVRDYINEILDYGGY